jgi:dihydrofolate synthase/folylpolyglutamate synthase
VIKPVLSVITNIGKDHVRFLGDTIEKIATEKAGIIKAGVPVVIGQTQVEAQLVFRAVALQMNSDIRFADQEYSIAIVKTFDDDLSGIMLDVIKNERRFIKGIEIPFTADYQLKNALTVIAAVESLKHNHYMITDASMRRGFRNVIRNTGLAGRWQVLARTPLTICDTGHNQDGIQEVVAQIRKITFSRLHVVLGVVNDKDIDGMLALLPADAIYYFCKADIPRGLDPGTLMTLAGKHGLSGNCFPSVKSAYAAALSAAGQNDLVFIGGSTFVVAEIL